MTISVFSKLLRFTSPCPWFSHFTLWWGSYGALLLHDRVLPPWGPIGRERGSGVVCTGSDPL